MNFLEEEVYNILKANGAKTEVQIRQALKLDGWDTRPAVVGVALKLMVDSGRLLLTAGRYAAVVGMPQVAFNGTGFVLEYDGVRQVPKRRSK